MKKLNLKINKGITLISLVTTIVVILTLTSMMVYSSPDYMHSKKLKDLYNDVEIIQDKVKNYYAKYNKVPGYVQYTWTKDPSGKYYIVDLQSLDALTLNYGQDGYELYKVHRDSALNGHITNEQIDALNEQTDIFIFNAETLNVFYVEGLSYDGVTYYSLLENEIGGGVVTPPVVGQQYLVDVVEIGDYVDIGIDYTNQMSFSSGYTTSTTALTGWRVLSKSGTGAEGTVTLVSAGTPLKYYHPAGGVSSTSISNLSDLNKTLPQGTSSSIGYTASGFENGTFDLASVWSSNSNIDGTTAHAMTTSEVEATYAELTGTSKTISELFNMTQPLETSNITSVNSNMSAKAHDLLGIGMDYWLGGSSYSANRLWNVSNSGYVYDGDYNTSGVRPVFSLKSGVQIAGDNTGRGTSESEAYKLAD